MKTESSALSLNSNNLQIYNEKLSLAEYIKKVYTFPILTEEEEKFLLQDFFYNNNPQSGKILLNSHLRLVVKIAIQYKKFYHSLMELISEGNLGLLKALKKFSITKEVRFSTYAMLWIKASIQEFLLKSSSSIKLGASNVQKKLMFNLAKAKKFLGITDDSLTQETSKKLSSLLNVTQDEIKNYERMIQETRQHSLNDLQFDEGEGERGDYISNGENLEDLQIKNNSQKLLQEKLFSALTMLPEREAEIVKLRILNQEKATLLEISNKFGISKERVRQIETKALKTLKDILEKEKNNLYKLISN